MALNFEVRDATTDIVALDVDLNGDSISYTGSGKILEFVIFSYQLEEEVNILTIYARDFAGNVLEITFFIPTVEPEPTDTTKSNGAFTPLVLLLSIFGITTIAFYRRRK